MFRELGVAFNLYLNNKLIKVSFAFENEYIKYDKNNHLLLKPIYKRIEMKVKEILNENDLPYKNEYYKQIKKVFIKHEITI